MDDTSNEVPENDDIESIVVANRNLIQALKNLTKTVIHISDSTASQAPLLTDEKNGDVSIDAKTL